jgi:mutator protein MutT
MQQKIATKALIINDDGRVLLLRKGNDDARHSGHSGRYNLPGGKIDPGETIADALAREVHEETGLIIGGGEYHPFYAGDWRPVVRGVQLQIIGMFFVCRAWSGEVVLNDEHDALLWIDAQTMRDFDILTPEDEAIRMYFEGIKK